MIALDEKDAATIRRLLLLITRLEPGSYPSALEKALALDMLRKLG